MSIELEAEGANTGGNQVDEGGCAVQVVRLEPDRAGGAVSGRRGRETSE